MFSPFLFVNTFRRLCVCLDLLYSVEKNEEEIVHFGFAPSSRARPPRHGAVRY